jgi:hypothetical protein
LDDAHISLDVADHVARAHRPLTRSACDGLGHYPSADPEVLVRLEIKLWRAIEAEIRSATASPSGWLEIMAALDWARVPIDQLPPSSVGA